MGIDYDELYGGEKKLKSEIRRERLAERMESLPALPEGAGIKEMAQSVMEDVFATYYSIMMDDSAPMGIRKQCADAIADRAVGKPAQEIEHSGKVQFEQLIIQRTPKTPEALPVIECKVDE
jgi:hypothetical protein